MRKRFIVLIAVISLFLFIISFWWKQAITPVNPGSQNKIVFTIKKGETSRIIANELYRQNLIRSPVAFFLIARFRGFADALQAGEFRLSPAMDLYTIINSLTHGSADVWITIPEGWRKEEIALELTQKLSLPESEFLKNSQEGYLFPDTYLIPKDASATSVVNILKTNFDQKMNPQIMDKVLKKKLTLQDVITIASLVEREGKHALDRPIIASVILNRLQLGMKLDIDATVQYILGYQAKEKTWWKKDLTLEDLNTDSPFNTYQNAGLPPAPIANPGIEAIMAVVNAPDTDYLYYISDSQGNIHPAKTIQEHNANIAKYLNQ